MNKQVMYIVANETRLLVRPRLKADESLVSYVLRLGESNYYERPGWIFRECGLSKGMVDQIWSQGVPVCGTLDLDRLAVLSGGDNKALAALASPPANGKGDQGPVMVFNQPVERKFLRRYPAKICPECLKKDPYLRKIWEVALVTTCPEHKCLLVDTCPECGNGLPWLRKSITWCPCGFDLRQIKSSGREKADLSIPKWIHSLCGLTMGENAELAMEAENPLLGQSLGGFSSALWFILSELNSEEYDFRRNGFPNIPVKALNRMLVDSLDVFIDWPNGFHVFLGSLRKKENGSKRDTGLTKDFGGFHRRLSRALPGGGLDFIWDTFQEYLTESWDGGYINGKCTGVSKRALKKRKKLPATKAAKDIGCKVEKVADLMEKGILKGESRKMGSRMCRLVEKESVDAYKKEMDASLNLTETMAVLGVGRYVVIELVNAGFLMPVQNLLPSSGNQWPFMRQEVDSFLKDLGKKVKANRDGEEGSVISFRKVGSMLSRTELKGSERLVSAVLNGEVRPCRMDSGKGIPGLYFNHVHIREVLRKYAFAEEGVWNVHEAAKHIGIPVQSAYFLAQRGLLKALRHQSEEKGTWAFRRDAVERFKKKYVTTRELADRMGSLPQHVIRRFKKKGIQPVSGKDVDGGLIYLFLRKEARHSAYREQKRPSRTLATGQVGKLLGISDQDVDKLVKAGKLPTYGPKNPGKGKYRRFTKHAVERYSKLYLENQDLITAPKAAEILGEDLSWFYKKYVKTGRIEPIEVKDDLAKHFFKIEDVRAMVKLKEETITGPEAAKLLGVHRTTIMKLTKRGKLKPVSGPGIDGFGCYLYLQEDIDRLLKTKNQDVQVPPG